MISTLRKLHGCGQIRLSREHASLILLSGTWFLAVGLRLLLLRLFDREKLLLGENHDEVVRAGDQFAAQKDPADLFGLLGQ